VSLLGALMSAAYCIIAIVMSATVRPGPSVNYNPAAVHRSPVERVMGIFNAMTTVFFAYGGHNVALEIQATIPIGGKHPLSTVPAMMRGVNVTFLVTGAPRHGPEHPCCLLPLRCLRAADNAAPHAHATHKHTHTHHAGLCYFGVSILGFYAFGTGVTENVLMAFGQGPTHWVVTMANLMVVIHVAAAYQVRRTQGGGAGQGCWVWRAAGLRHRRRAPDTPTNSHQQTATNTHQQHACCRALAATQVYTQPVFSLIEARLDAAAAPAAGAAPPRCASLHLPVKVGLRLVYASLTTLVAVLVRRGARGARVCVFCACVGSVFSHGACLCMAAVRMPMLTALHLTRRCRPTPPVLARCPSLEPSWVSSVRCCACVCVCVWMVRCGAPPGSRHNQASRPLF
jgi:hypothetical protein